MAQKKGLQCESYTYCFKWIVQNCCEGCIHETRIESPIFFTGINKENERRLYMYVMGLFDLLRYLIPIKIMLIILLYYLF